MEIQVTGYVQGEIFLWEKLALDSVPFEQSRCLDHVYPASKECALLSVMTYIDCNLQFSYL